MWMIVFLLLPLLGLAYCGWHVWTLVPLPKLWRSLVVIAGGFSFLLIFLNLSRTIDRLPMWLAGLCYDVGNSSVFVLMYLVMVFLVLDLARLLRIVPSAWLQQNFYTTVVITVAMFAVFLLGNIRYTRKVRVEQTVTTAKQLRRALRLVMLSDLHLGYHNPRKELARWVDIVNAEKPDVVLIAGDIIDMSIRPLVEERMYEEFRRLAAPVYACLGNHEYYTGEPLAQQFYRDAGINLLRDSSAVVGDLLIIGRDDRSNMHRKKLSEIMEEVSYPSPLASHPSPLASRFSILLDHQPYDLEQAELAGLDFQFSGHTHRGQVWPVSWITDRIYECSFGPWQRGNTRYYVSSGIGIWGGKFRIGTQSEYVVMTINNRQ